jgi:formate C-acetyltransferase
VGNRFWLLPLGGAAALLLAVDALLVSRRREKSVGAEMLGAAGLCLAAPAAYLVAGGPSLASAAGLPIAQLSGGQALDIAISHALLSTESGRGQFRALLETYFRLGGADLQINTADPADLRTAQARPEDYAHLIVRVAGYSEFFTKLDRAQQDDLIVRISAGV